MANHSPTNQRHFDKGTWSQTTGNLPEETPVSLTVNGIEWLTFSCTPLLLEALAIGFLFNEQVINSIQEVASIRVCPAGDDIDAWLTHSAEKPVNWLRTSGCTGGATRVNLKNIQPGNQAPSIFTPEEIIHSMELLSRIQDLYRETGGVHSSAISDGTALIVSAEDIGRHNTLDKIAGTMLMQNLNPHRNMLLTTGRISSEMLQKSVHMGASMIVSRTSPTTSSAEMAEQLGICLVGYARGNRFTAYTHSEHIASDKHLPDGRQVKISTPSSEPGSRPE
jgi:FdhD protein